MASILAMPLDHVRDHTPVYDHILMSYWSKSAVFCVTLVLVPSSMGKNAGKI